MRKPKYHNRAQELNKPFNSLFEMQHKRGVLRREAVGGFQFSI